MSLKRWHAEKWTNQKGDPCGSNTTKNEPKCRPSVKVSSKTPVTWGELTESQKKRAISDKQKTAKKGEQFSKVRFSRIKDKLKNGKN